MQSRSPNVSGGNHFFKFNFFLLQKALIFFAFGAHPIVLFQGHHRSRIPDCISRSAGLDMGNPAGLLLAGSMMLQQLGWTEAAAMVAQSVQVSPSTPRLAKVTAHQNGFPCFGAALHPIQKTIASKAVPLDLKRLAHENPKALHCSEFSRAVVENMQAPDA